MSDGGHTVVGNWSLVNAKRFFDGDADQRGLERGSVAFVNTHGGISKDRHRVALSMYETETYAWTHDMYLGNESVGLSIFAAYACDTLKQLTTKPDNKADWAAIHDNFDSTFRGGLRVFLGSTDVFFSAWTTSEVGEDFADQLREGRLVIDAWGDSTQDWALDHYPAGMTSGRNNDDAAERLDSMTLQNFSTFGRLRDENVKRFSYAKWVD